jgi:hypothetical protein
MYRLRQILKEQFLQLESIKTEENEADLFPKSLPVEQIQVCAVCLTVVGSTKVLFISLSMSSSGAEKAEKGEKGWYPGKFLKERRKSTSTKDDDQMDSSSSSAAPVGEVKPPNPTPSTPSTTTPVSTASTATPPPPVSSSPTAQNSRTEVAETKLRHIQRESSIDSVKSKPPVEDPPKHKERKSTTSSSNSSKESPWYPGTV